MDQSMIIKLRTEYLDCPLGIDTKAPRLGWIMQSKRRSASQSAYRIIAASSQQVLDQDEGDLWDSGVVVSSQSQHIVYSGSPLQSEQRVHWKVRVWDEQGEALAWSETASWTMGLLSRLEWEGCLIGRASGRKPSREEPLPVVYLRRSFRSEGAVRRATVYATALGLYRLHLNGVRIGNDALTPEWTDYHVRTQYQTYDITSCIQSGDNVISTLLGHGWYTGYIGMYGYQRYGMEPSFLLQMNIEYEDGTRQSLSTDDDWKAGFGQIVGSDLQMGENWDARLEPHGWQERSFDDDRWASASRMHDYRGKLVAQMSPPIRALQSRTPSDIRRLAEETILVDMGQMTSGYLRIVVQASEGTRYTLRYAEALDEEGRLYTENLRYARQTDTYICHGSGRETFEPVFTYHGYRYVEISGGPAPLPEDIEGIVVYSSLPEVGTLETSNPLVNKLIDNIRWTQRANYMSVPTDCPQRDERHGWTGDAQIFAPTAAYNMDVSAFLAKWLNDMEDGQRPTGAFTDFAPFIFGPKTEFDNDFTYTHTASAGWADAPPIIAWLLFERYGDSQLLRKHYASMKRWMDYNEALYPSGIRRDAPQYGDWLSIDERPFTETKEEFGWQVDAHSTTPYDVFATAYWANGVKLMSNIAHVIGEEADAAHYDKLYEFVRAAFIREFVSDAGEIRGDTQTVYALALAWSLVPDQLRDAALTRLVGKIEAAGDLAATGFHGTKHLMEVLSENGHESLAFRLLLREQYPSWLYSVLQGATTIWERWDGWTVANGFQDPGMNSLCHYAFGSVGEWLYRHVGGIRLDPTASGFSRSVIRPRPLGGIHSAKCEYDSIQGLISTKWTLQSDVFELMLTVPANGTAFVHMPSEEGTLVTEGGLPAASVPGIRVMGREGDCEVLLVESGSYQFKSFYETSRHK
ncbi:family 78 glycoside hydrolase catalytic domain [Paenibacillus alba]|uniref:alpha-L-rhamnosidase n=1 Tax=Paenibacillus alba TaxID=1197127 RepID=UPI001566B9EE|nr:alpha-L-rhamnosidase [Paenibacillus alba]NQX66164.1 family 78 glycoside hydrolase catalytic domain [Paenibacillus alba]